MSSPQQNTPTNIGTKILQINIGKRISASMTLLNELQSTNICAIQEPFARKNRIPNVPRSHKQFVPYSSDKARVALIVPIDLARNAMSLGAFNNRDCIVLRIRISSSLTILIASIYMDITSPIPELSINRLTALASAEDLPLVICTDSNAHHTAWGHSSTNARGRALFPIINSNNLIISNTGNTPTFQNHIGSSVIDLTLCNSKAINLIQKWKVSTGASTSDHNLISFNLDFGGRDYVINRSVKRCDWEVYKTLVAHRFQQQPFRFKPNLTQQDLNTKQDFINDILEDCFNTACPIIRGKIKTSAPWWTPELTKAKSTAKYLRRRANRTKRQEDRDKCKTADKQYTHDIIQAKNLGWKNYCSDIEGAQASARISKILNHDSSRTGFLNSIKRQDGSLTITPLETLEALATELIPGDGIPTIRTYSTPDIERINRAVAPHRVDRAIRELKSNKSPGPDNIRNNMISEAWQTIKAPVRSILYHSLVNSSSPASWWENKGVTIAKPSKPDYTNPRAFRIISLTSGFQKILEKLILWSVQQENNISVKLTQNQHGFRKGASTDSAIHNLTRKIEDAVNRGDYAIGVFLDIEGAFDNISFSSITDALTELQIPTVFVDWIHHMISNRYVSITFGGHTVRRRVTKGCPQGGVLSPLLWNITLNTLLSRLGYDSSFIQAFADDLVILIQGICKSTIRDIAQRNLNNINRWCHSKSIKLSELKTKVIIFTRRKDSNLPTPLRINGRILDQSTSAVYLGVTYDSKLSWIPHIISKTNKGICMLQACSKAISKTWGLNPTSTRWLFQQVILPAVTYGAFTWQHIYTTSKQARTALDRLQRNAALMITRGLRSTPTANLEIMAGIRPIKHVLEHAAIASAIRLIINNRWIENYHINRRGYFDSHAHSTNLLLAQLPISSCKYSDTCPSFTVIDRKFRSIILDRELTITLISNIPTNIWQVYTDGSRRNELAGAGFCIIHNNTEIYSAYANLGSFPTVFQCELYAINQAAAWVEANVNRSETVLFFTDSQATIQALNSTNSSSVMIRETIDLLNSIGHSVFATIYWVPGHMDVAGNERADELARQGSGTRPIGPEPFLPFTTANSKTEINRYFHSKHVSEYSKKDISEKGKIPISSILNTYPKKMRQAKGQHLRQLTWLFSGHSPLNYFQYKTGGSKTQTCQQCNEEPETSLHFLGECVAFATIRLRTTGHIVMNWKQIADTNINLIVDYIAATNRLNHSAIFQPTT